MPQRTALIVDSLGWSMASADKELADIEDDLREHGLDPAIVYAGTEFGKIPDLDVELLVIDFGGLARSYSSPVGDYMRATLKWADEHPSSFVFLWSTTTGDIIAEEVRRNMPDEGFEKGWYLPVAWPANIRALGKGYTTAAYYSGKKDEAGYAKDDDWDDWQDESWRRARAWFGVPE